MLVAVWLGLAMMFMVNGGVEIAVYRLVATEFSRLLPQALKGNVIIYRTSVVLFYMEFILPCVFVAQFL